MSLRTQVFCRTAMLAILVLAVMPASAQGPAAALPPYMDPAKPIDVRVDDLVSRMTLEEKASQLVNQARAIPRLNVPAYDWWSEALHGVGFSGIATVFPEPIGLAATFDAPLVHEMAVAIGIEARVKHNQSVRAGRRDIMEGLDFWSPNINIFRDPRWGRGQETYGEDPFLTARLGVAFVTGLQGDDPKYYRVISTPKHFAVHSGPEPTRHSMDIKVSKHDMEDTYLPAFRATVVDGKAGSVMCAYNRVNGVPACANSFLLEDQLRGAWRFSGYVVSDCGAVSNIVGGHHFTQTMAEAAAVSIKAGMDNECADYFPKITDNSDYVQYLDAVKQGLLSERDLDITLRRLFTARMRLGMFDPAEQVPYAQTPDSELDSPAHRELALKMARESMVLLKNDGVLPFGPKVRRIAVVGPLAESERVLLGNYNGIPSQAVTALQGIRKQFGEANVTYAPGTKFLREEVLIPASVLSTPDGKPGLKGEYFSGKDFEGTPAVVRTDNSANLQPLRPDPTELTPPEGLKDFSVRWTGFLIPKQSGDYNIGVVGELNRLWLDDQLVVDDAALHEPRSTVKAVHLRKGHRYRLKLEYGKGGFGTKLVWLPPPSGDPLADAVASARAADVIVAVVGIASQLEGEEMKVEVPGFNGGDRTSLDLPKPEQDLLEAVQRSGKPVVVVLMNGSALAVNSAQENCNAILDAWYSGEEGGTAIAQTLAGINNPSGRLPVTFYKGVEQLPPFEDYSMKNRTYRYFEQAPLYPFGYGLSYSKFEYTDLKLSNRNIHAGDLLEVDVSVSNRSTTDGDEVAQLYLSFPKIAGAPLRALRGFQRLHMKAQETRTIHFDVGPRDLSMVNESGDRMVAAGSYRISVGGGQPGTGVPGAEASLTIHDNERLPE